MASKQSYDRLDSEHELQDRSDPFFFKAQPSSSETKQNADILRLVVMAFAVNLFFWLSMIFSLLAIDWYGNRNWRALYLTVSWLIFAMPSTFTALLVFIPRVTRLQKWRDGFSKLRAGKFIANDAFYFERLICD